MEKNVYKNQCPFEYRYETNFDIINQMFFSYCISAAAFLFF